MAIENLNTSSYQESQSFSSTFSCTSHFNRLQLNSQIKQFAVQNNQDEEDSILNKISLDDLQQLKQKIIQVKLINPISLIKAFIKIDTSDKFQSELEKNLKKKPTLNFNPELAKAQIDIAKKYQDAILNMSKVCQEEMYASSLLCHSIVQCLPKLFQKTISKESILKKETFCLNQKISMKQTIAQEYENRIKEGKVKVCDFHYKIRDIKQKQRFFFKNLSDIKDDLKDISFKTKNLFTEQINDCQKILEISKISDQNLKISQDYAASIRLKIANFKLSAHNLKELTHDLRGKLSIKNEELDKIKKQYEEKCVVNSEKLQEFKNIKKDLNEEFQNLNSKISQKQQEITVMNDSCVKYQEQIYFLENQYKKMNIEIMAKYFDYKKKKNSLKKLTQDVGSFEPSTSTLLERQKALLIKNDTEMDSFKNEHDLLKKQSEDLDKEFHKLDNSFDEEHERKMKNMKNSMLLMKIQISLQTQKEQMLERQKQEKQELEDKIRKEKEEELKREQEELRKFQEEQKEKEKVEKERKDKEIAEFEIQEQKKRQEERLIREEEKRKIEEEEKHQKKIEENHKKRLEEERKRLETEKQKKIEEEERIYKKEEQKKLDEEKKQNFRYEEKQKKLIDETKQIEKDLKGKEDLYSENEYNHKRSENENSLKRSRLQLQLKKIQNEQQTRIKEERRRRREDLLTRLQARERIEKEQDLQRKQREEASDNDILKHKESLLPKKSVSFNDTTKVFEIPKENTGRYFGKLKNKAKTDNLTFFDEQNTVSNLNQEQICTSLKDDSNNLPATRNEITKISAMEVVSSTSNFLNRPSVLPLVSNNSSSSNSQPINSPNKSKTSHWFDELFS